VQFHQVNQESSQPWRVRLVNCNAEGVLFEDNNWHSENSRRLVLQDELDLSTTGSSDELAKTNHELVAIAYRRLFGNFNRTRAYDLAEDCYVGAMEMRLLNPETPTLTRVVSWIYKMASFYGTSYKRAVVAMAALIVAFTLLFLLAGFSNTDGRVVEYNLLPNAGHGIPSRSQAISDYADAFILTLLTMTFRSSQYFRPLGFWSQLVVVVSTIVLTSQLALFILALRRRFRR
jgi:hypothetical protein